MTRAGRWWSAILDLVYPRSCSICGSPPEDDADHFCWDCLSGISMVQAPYCSRCGDPVDGRVDGDFVCYYCGEHNPHFDCARSAARYDGPLRKAICSFKYNQALWLRRDLVRMLHACAEHHYGSTEIDAVTYVPLFPARRRQRGFNQAQLLANGMAKLMHKPLLRNCLARVRPTPSQTNLTASQRITNVKGAFRAKKARWLEGRRLLLVDDVMTTGATVSECSRVFKAAGVSRVYVVTLARG